MALLALASWFLCAGSARAQDSSYPYSCHTQGVPYNAEYGTNPGSRGSTHARNYVDSVTFDGPVDLTGEELQEVVTLLKTEEFEREANWLQKIQDMLRQPWLDHGYHKAEVIAKAAPVGGDDGRYAITAHVDEGFQYRVGRIDFVAANSGYVVSGSSTDKPSVYRLPADTDGLGFANSEKRPVFPVEELRNLMPLREGDIFDHRKIRAGLDALNELYGEHGYIDFTAEPITRIDDEYQLISLKIDLVEEEQFHIGKIEVQGLDPSTRSALIWNIKTGDVFNHEMIQKFFNDNKSNFPAGSYWAKDPEVVRNMKTSTVDLKFTFGSCLGR